MMMMMMIMEEMTMILMMMMLIAMVVVVIVTLIPLLLMIVAIIFIVLQFYAIMKGFLGVYNYRIIKKGEKCCYCKYLDFLAGLLVTGRSLSAEITLQRGHLNSPRVGQRGCQKMKMIAKNL